MWNPLAFANKIVQLAAPVTTNGGVTSDVISLKNAVRATIIVDLKQAVGHATVISLKQCTDVAGATNKAGPTSKIWSNEDVAATDTLVAQTDAASYTVTNDIKSKQVVIEVDPAALDMDNGYDCVFVTLSDSSQATNLVGIDAFIRTNYQQTTPPAAITD
jgi:hypothetical protein